MTGNFDLGGGGGKSFSFGSQGSQPGTSVTGTVIDVREVQETNYDTKKPEFWDNGDPKMQIKVSLQTDLRDPANPTDDGVRDVYLSGYRKAHPTTGTSGTLWAVLEAVRATTGGTSMAYGGRLTLQWVSGMGFTGDPRHYVAKYELPTVDLAGGQAAPAVQPQQAAPQGYAQQAYAQQVAPPQQQYQAPPAQVAPPAQPMQQAVQPAAAQPPVQAQAPAPALPPGLNLTPEQMAAVQAMQAQPQG